MRLFMIVLNR